MYAIDFEYDGQYLSDYGFIICDPFAFSGLKKYDGGANITFHKVPTNHGKKYNLCMVEYTDCIRATLDIIKNPAIYADNMQITNDEYRDLMRWLNRREFLKFQLLGGDDYDGETCYYEASFNVDKLEIDGELYGLELAVETNAPFGYGQEQVHRWTVRDVNKPYILSDISDEIGRTYPDLKIEILEDGTLTLHNEFNDSTLKVTQCKAGEIITINSNSQIIKSSLERNVCNAWNCEYFAIENSINSRMNTITCSLPCKIELRYIPTVKSSIE